MSPFEDPTDCSAVQSAQEMERRAQDSKKRFVAYIFHEVRVPLNTARLALSNLDAEGAFSTLPQDQRELLVGLDVSLRTMGKVSRTITELMAGPQRCPLVQPHGKRQPRPDA